MANISAEEKAAREAAKAAEAAEAEKAATKSNEPSEIDLLKAQIDELKKLITDSTKKEDQEKAVNSPLKRPRIPHEKKLVPVLMFQDNERYKDDVYAAVNGENFQIQRGEIVNVPDYVKEVLDAGLEHDNETIKKMRKLSSDYEEATRKL